MNIRRSEGERRLAVEQYQPPLRVVAGWRERIPALAVKLAPGVSLREIERHDAEIEFLSVAGELKECVLWFGPLQTTRRRATRLPEAISLTDDEGIPDSRLSEPRDFLYDPDPAIVRAGLVARLARDLDAYQLDASVAYLTGSRRVKSPLARVYRIEETLPFQLKRLRERLRQLDVGSVDVKRRGSAVETNTLLKGLKLAGTQHRILVLTRAAGKPVVLICASCEKD